MSRLLPFPDDGQKGLPDRQIRRAACNPQSGRKAQQLCRQVQIALQLIFGGFADEVLQSLTVVSVDPAPHGGQLQVTVAVPRPADVTDRIRAVEHLGRAGGAIRCEVAAFIHRRKVPELTFLVV